MATKKKAEAAPAPKKKGGKKAAPKAAEGADAAGAVDDKTIDLEAHIHEKGAAGLVEAKDVEAPAVIDSSAVVHDAVDDATAEEAAAESPATAFSLVIERALRFAVKDGNQQRIWLFPNVVRAYGPQGSIHIPWASPKLPEGGVVVDGKGLKQKLRVAGADAVVDYEDGRLVITYGGSRRFTQKTFPHVEFPGTLPPALAQDEWTFVDPSPFLRAVPFAGDDKAQPPVISGLHISRGSVCATDKRTLIVVPNFTDKTSIDVVLPRGAFDGISVDDKTGDCRCWMGLTADSKIVIGDPRNGEYRVLSSWGGGFPDIRTVVASFKIDFLMSVDKNDFISALREMKLVQSAGSGVKLWVWVVPPGQPGAGHYLELRGGDSGLNNELTARLPVRLRLPTQGPGGEDVVPPGLAGGNGSFKVCAASDLLLKLAKQIRGSSVTIGCGPDDKSPLTLMTHEFTAAVAVMVD